MVKVVQAQFRRIVHQRGQASAEVEVRTDQLANPNLLVYFVLLQDGTFPIIRVVANEADSEIDWYDNNMHMAFKDITEQFFQEINKNRSGSMKYEEQIDRTELARQIMAYDHVKAAIKQSHFTLN